MCQSYVTTGTWSFDLLGEDDTLVAFMSSSPFLWQNITAVVVARFGSSASGFVTDLGVGTAGNLGVIQEYAFPIGTRMTGWQHINITRGSDGRICVYHNRTLVIDKVVTSVTTSECFWVSPLFTREGNIASSGKYEGAIDNIVVSDTVDIQPPPPPFYMQTWFLVTVAVAVVAVVIAAALFKRSRRRGRAVQP